MRNVTKAYEKASRGNECDDLIVNNLEYVRHILGRLAANLPDGVDIENLESAGVMGLVEAAQQFDQSRGVEFRTFSYARIRGAIIDELRRNCPLPQQVLQQAAKIREAMERIEPPATPEAIAAESGLTLEEVVACTQAMQLTRLRSWEDYEMTRQSATEDHSPPDAELVLAENKRIAAECIETLPQQERLVITLYYLEDLRLKEIGRVLNLSESRISRILTKAQMRLREMVRAYQH
jgi:RNA polymerase sigma factor for flagellar operon FliA